MSSAATAGRSLVARPGSGTLVDVAIAVVALAGTLAQLSHGGIAGTQTGPGGLEWTAGVLAVASTVPILAWRRAPWTVFAFTASAVVALGAAGDPIPVPLGPAAALYLLAASRDDDDVWARRETGAVVALFVAYIAATAISKGGFPGTVLLHSGLAWGVAWFAGERTRLRREHLADLSERAERAEHETERERRLAVAEERGRIARDLHDAAGHAINVIAVRAGTARMRRDPERSQTALEAIEELARRTVGEIDQIVGTLRESGSANGAVDAPPGLASLDALVARHAAAGLGVSVASAGEPRPLAGTVDQGAYRILQEALTNAARHGSGPARVELGYREAALEMTITNAAADESGPRSNGGHGLIGMRERATLLGGSLNVERANGSFRVRARLPYGGHAP